MEQAPSTSFSRVESRLSFVSIDKTTFRTVRPNIGSAAYMEEFSSLRLLPSNIRAKFMPLNMPNTMDLSFISKMQVLGKGPKYVLSCTIPTLDRQLSYGDSCSQYGFYLERSTPWREHKRLLFVSFKPGHKRDIVPPTISGWIQKTILSPTRLRRTRYDPWLHRSHSTDRPP